MLPAGHRGQHRQDPAIKQAARNAAWNRFYARHAYRLAGKARRYRQLHARTKLQTRLRGIRQNERNWLLRLDGRARIMGGAIVDRPLVKGEFSRVKRELANCASRRIQVWANEFIRKPVIR